MTDSTFELHFSIIWAMYFYSFFICIAKCLSNMIGFDKQIYSFKIIITNKALRLVITPCLTLGCQTDLRTIRSKPGLPK